jgi:dihydroflavonol-4-reductase
METVCVTGAAGYLASHVIVHLLRAGYNVRGTIRCDITSDRVAHLVNMPEFASGRLALVQADLLKDDGWAEAFKDCAYIMHVASPAPASKPKDDDELIKPAVDGMPQACRMPRHACAKICPIACRYTPGNASSRCHPDCEARYCDIFE